MTKIARIHYHRAQRIYDRLGRGSVADIDAIAQALAEAEREGLMRASQMVASYWGKAGDVIGSPIHGALKGVRAEILSEAES